MSLVVKSKGPGSRLPDLNPSSATYCCFVTLDKIMPQFPHLYNGANDNTTFLDCKELGHVKH